MTHESYFQPQLSLQRGSLDYISVCMNYERHEGWTVRFWHRHSGESMLCPGHVTYGPLVLAEATQLVQDVLQHANGHFSEQSGECHPL